MDAKPTEQEQAYNLFYQTDLSQQQIADVLNINRKTLYLWIKEGDWLRTKYSARNGPMQLAERYYAQLQALNDDIAARTDHPYPTKEESEIIKRLTGTIRQLGGRQTLGETVEILSMFLDTIQRQNRDLSLKVIPYMTAHIRSQTRNVPLAEKLQRDAQRVRFDKEYEEYLATHPEDSLRKPQPAHGPGGIATHSDSTVCSPVAAAPAFPLPQQTAQSNVISSAIKPEGAHSGSQVHTPSAPAATPHPGTDRVTIGQPNTPSSLLQYLPKSAPSLPIANNIDVTGLSGAPQKNVENRAIPLPLPPATSHPSKDINAKGMGG